MAHSILSNIDNRYDIDTNICVVDIKEYFRRHRNSGPFFSMFEVGLDGKRFDMIRIDPHREYVRIFEFKSGRKDFISDKKWQNYLKYCHTFTFVCPVSAIQKEDILPQVGLMWIYRWRHKGYQGTKWHLASEWVRKPKKQNVSKDILLRLAFTLLYRMIWRRDQIF